MALALHIASNMIRASLFIAAVAAVIPACAASSGPADELGEETAADGEEGKGDAAGAFTFYNLIADNRACSLNSPSGCGIGFFLSRANRSTTQCGRGTPQSQCKITELDWSGTALPPSVAKSYEDRLRDGQPLLVKGDVVPAANDAGLSFAVKELWVTNNPEFVEGVFAVVKDNGIRCVRAPCPSLTERRLNSNLSAQITGLDFDASGAEQADIDLAREQLYSADGLVVVGYRDYDSLGGKTRTVNRFFTKAPVPLH
ncbi:MAG TPA: DUF6748 domain-containing protein [Kofleriaceae bacterium]|nr:DUF6748 domain-containing protein [Kofleriaceae bacterium]